MPWKKVSTRSTDGRLQAFGIGLMLGLASIAIAFSVMSKLKGY